MMKNPWFLTVLLGVILFGGAIIFSGGAVAEPEYQETIVENDFNAHILGNPDAEVKLVEFSDFQCPACASFHPVVKDLMDTYGDLISFEYKHFPLAMHPFAMQASVAAEAAGQQGKFFEYYDKLFENQKNWSSSQNPNIFFIQYASELGLDMERFKKEMTSSTLRDEKVKKDQAEAFKLDVNATPSFFLNGKKMEFDTFEEFMSQVVGEIMPDGFGADGSSTPISAPPADVRFGF